MSWHPQAGYPVPVQSTWQVLASPDGRPYYYNPQTRVTQWEKPEELKAPQERSSSQSLWTEYTSADGRKYYHNAQTQETRWEPPPEMHQQSHAPSYTSSNNMMATHSQQQHQPSPMDDGPTYASHEEAVKAFKSLLNDKGVKSDWTWEQTMRATVKEPRYRALKSLKERKDAFNQYVTDRRHFEEQDREERGRKRKKDLEHLLENDRRVTTIMRYRTAKSVLANEPEFVAFDNDADRERCFSDYMRERRRQDEDKARIKRKNNMETFATLLQDLDIDHTTSWLDAQDIYRSSKEYQRNKDLQEMDPLDFLSVFEVHINGLEQEHNEERQKAKVEMQRRERKNREAFIALLDSLRQEGSITAKTKWMDLYPKIKATDAYKNLLGQLGSSPLELFWDVVEELDIRLYEQRRLAENVLRDADFAVDEDMDERMVMDFLQKDPRMHNIAPKDVQLVVEALKDKAARRKREEQRRAERKLRHAIDDLRSTIKHLDPPVTLQDTWEVVKPRVEMTSTYKALEVEDHRKAAYEKHMSRLQEKAQGKEHRTGSEPHHGGRKRKSTSRHNERDERSPHTKSTPKAQKELRRREGSHAVSSLADDSSSDDEESRKRIKREASPQKPLLQPDSESEEGEILE